MASRWADLEYSDEEMLDKATEAGVPTQASHPYGMRSCLTGRELEMCQLPMPSVGDMLHMSMMGTVTHVSDGPDGCRVEVQWEKVRLEDEDTEEEDEE